MKSIQKFLNWLNAYQQDHRLTAFVIGVIKKYDDDQGGRQAALLTYYSFLSLFPLLLVLTTITDTLIGKHAHFKETIIKGLTDYFPLLGSQLSTQVHRLHTYGPALIIGLLFTLYGTRGVANSFINGVQDMWHISKKDRFTFPKSLYKSLGIVVVGGCGLLGASIIASLTSAAGHGWDFRLLSIVVNLVLLASVFIFLLNFSLPRHITLKEMWLGAVVGAIGLIVLQLLGGYILAHELKHLDVLYSYFAVALGLVFWLYLQSQVIYYSIEISLVSSKGFWPRSLDASKPTKADIKLASIRADQVK
jgi:membrane protein